MQGFIADYAKAGVIARVFDNADEALAWLEKQDAAPADTAIPAER